MKPGRAIVLTSRTSGGGATDPFFSSVIALLHMDGADGSTTFTDQIGNTWARGTANPSNTCGITTSTSQFGGASGNFDNRGIDTTQTPFNLGTGDWTIECWIYPGDTGTDRDFIAHRNSGDNNNFWFIRRTSTNKIRVFCKTGGSTICDVTSTSTISGSTWTSVKVQRKTGVIEVYIGTGKETLSGSNSSAGQSWAFPSFVFWIAAGDDTGTGGWFGKMDEVRITKGVARLSGATITLETSEFPNS